MKTRIYAYGNTFLTALKGLSFPIGNKALFQIAIYMSLFLLILFAYFLLWLLMLLLEKHFLRWYDQPSVLPYLWYPSAELLEFRSTYPATKINGMPKLNLLIEKVKNNILLADERLTVVVDGSVLRNKPRPTNNYFQQLYNQANNSTYELSTSPCIQVSMYLHFGFHFWTSDTQVLYLQIPQTGEVKLAFEPYNLFTRLRDRYAMYTLDVTATIGLCPHNQADEHQFITYSDKKEQIWVREKLDFFYLRQSIPEPSEAAKEVPITTAPTVAAADSSLKEIANNAEVIAQIFGNEPSAISSLDMNQASSWSKNRVEHSEPTGSIHTFAATATSDHHIAQHLSFPSCSLSYPSITSAHGIPMGHGIRFIQPEMMSTVQPLLPNRDQGYRLQVKLHIAAVYAHIPNGVRVVLKVNNVRFEFRRFFQLFPLSKDVQRQSLALLSRTSDQLSLPLVQYEQLQLQHEATLTIDDLIPGEINVLKVYTLSQSPLLDNDRNKEDGCDWLHNDMIYRCKFDEAAKEEDLNDILDYDCRTIMVS